MRDPGLAYVYSARETARKQFPIFPWQGIYGISSRIEFHEARQLMDFKSVDKYGKVCPVTVSWHKTFSEKGHKPYLIYYEYTCRDTCGVITCAYYQQLVEQKIIRYHKKHINLYWSPVHNFRCVTLDQAKEAVRIIREKKERKEAREKALIDGLPSTMVVKQELLTLQDHYEIKTNDVGVKYLVPAKALLPSGRFEHIEMDFVAAYVTKYTFGPDLVFVILDKDGERHMFASDNGKRFQKTHYLNQFMVDSVMASIPSKTFKFHGGSEVTRLSATRVKALLTKGELFAPDF